MVRIVSFLSLFASNFLEKWLCDGIIKRQNSGLLKVLIFAVWANKR